MEVMLIVFMVFAGIICLGTTSLIVVELIAKIKSTKGNKNVEPQQVVATVSDATEVAPQIQNPEQNVVEPVQTTEPTPEEENGIWINAGQSQTLEEKYLALDNTQRAWYDEIERYAMTKEGVKHYKNNRYEDYKIGKHRIVRLTIKRGVIQCEFVLINQDFRNYINDNKVAVKTAATVIKIESPEAVDAAKNSIDIAMNAVEAERLYKKEKQKEKRRQARLTTTDQDND